MAYLIVQQSSDLQLCDPIPQRGWGNTKLTQKASTSPSQRGGERYVIKETKHAMRLALDEAMEFDVKRTGTLGCIFLEYTTVGGHSKKKWKAEAVRATIPYGLRGQRGRDKDYKIRYLKSQIVIFFFFDENTFLFES